MQSSWSGRMGGGRGDRAGGGWRGWSDEASSSLLLLPPPLTPLARDLTLIVDARKSSKAKPCGVHKHKHYERQIHAEPASSVGSMSSESTLHTENARYEAQQLT